jgi:hydrogenase maturation protease
MSDATEHGPGVVIAGFGSPHGDDQAGWRLIEMLQQRPELPARVVAVREATELLEELGGCRKLVVVDACRCGGRMGTITRLEWPDPRIEQQHSHSSHGMGVCCALRLAERLGRLPPEVEVYGIEIAEWEPGHEITFEVLEAVKELDAVISAELCEAMPT